MFILYYDYIYYLLNKQVSGTISPEEEKILVKWYNTLQFSSRETGEHTDAARQAAWESLLTSLSAQQSGKVIAIDDRPRTRWNRLWIAAASVLLVLGLATTWVVLHNRDKATPLAWTLVETTQQKKSVTLPDGSIVWVNAHSRVRFSTAFSALRQVQVDYGEAFFEVKKDTLHPFVVNLPDLSVTVLGTAFNIQSFPELKDIKVTVTHGKVLVRDTLSLHQQLIANQRLVYSKQSHKALVDVLDPQKTNDWKNGNIYLKNITLRELAVYIKNIYDYDVVFEKKSLENCSNTINFRDKDSLKDVLDILKLLNKVQYRINNKTIYLDGAGCQ